MGSNEAASNSLLQLEEEVSGNDVNDGEAPHQLQRKGPAKLAVAFAFVVIGFIGLLCYGIGIKSVSHTNDVAKGDVRLDGTVKLHSKVSTISDADWQKLHFPRHFWDMPIKKRIKAMDNYLTPSSDKTCSKIKFGEKKESLLFCPIFEAPIREGIRNTIWENIFTASPNILHQALDDESSWDVQKPCTEWCKKQGELAPYLKQEHEDQLRQEFPEKYENYTGKLVLYPYHISGAGMVVGRAPTCNNDIPGDNYCSAGCRVDGKQMPCTLVQKSFGGTFYKGFMWTKHWTGDSDHAKSRPYVGTHNEKKTPSLENTQGGCSPYEKYCCCVDPFQRKRVQINGESGSLKY